MTISTGIFPSAARYTLFVEGATYYAKSATGALSYDTNASALVSLVLSSMISADAGTYRYPGTLHFAKGTFSFDTQINPQVPVGVEAVLGLTIEGEGRYVTNLRGVGEHPVFNFTGTDRFNRFEAITIRSLEISTDAGARSAGNHALIFVNATFVNVHDCYIYNAYDDGIYIHGLETDFIHDNGFYGNWGSGIAIAGESDVHIFGNSINANQLDGVTGLDAIYVDVDTNSIMMNLRFGIYYYAVEKSTITDNNIGVNGRDGIILNGNSDNCTIANNVIFENSNETTNSFDGIRIGDCKNNVITGNRIFDEAPAPFQRWGIKEEGTSDYNVIVGCSTVSGGATGGITVVGAHTVCHASYNLTVWVT